MQQGYGLFCVFDYPALSGKIDLYLSGIIHFVFYSLGDLPCNDDHLLVVDLFGNDHYSDLTSRLNSVGLLNAVIRGANFLQLLQTLDVILVVFASCSGTCRRNSVRRLNKAGNNGLGLNISVMRLNSVDNLGAFLILAANVDAYLNVREPSIS